jgi:two-component system, NarL family, sensor kinase
LLEERQRLARDLHDSVTQLLASATMIAQSVAAAYPRDPAEAERRLNRMVDLNRAALAEMRSLLEELHPGRPAVPFETDELPVPALTRVRCEGLAAGLLEHLENLRLVGVEVVAEVGGYRPQGRMAEEQLFRVAQEALNNVLKHAQAAHAWLALGCPGSRVELRIEDDGRGCAGRPVAAGKETPGREGGFGLVSMRGRVEALGGTLELSPREGGGTRLVVTVPQTPREAQP